MCGQLNLAAGPVFSKQVNSTNFRRWNELKNYDHIKSPFLHSPAETVQLAKKFLRYGSTRLSQRKIESTLSNYLRLLFSLNDKRYSIAAIQILKLKQDRFQSANEASNSREDLFNSQTIRRIERYVYSRSFFLSTGGRNPANFAKYYTDLSLYKNTPRKKYEKSLIYQLNSGESTITWTGRKYLGLHRGTVSFNNGFIEILNGKILSGDFLVDLTTIDVTDMTGKWRKKIVDHLMGSDFFAVRRFRFAKFTVLHAEDMSKGHFKLHGWLDIHGIRRSATANIELKINDSEILATGNLYFDRSKFNILYNSPTISVNLGDKIIHNRVDISIQAKLEPGNNDLDTLPILAQTKSK